MFIDSNVFCYYFNRSSDHHEETVQVLENALEEREMHTSVVVLMEVSHFLVNHLGPVKGKERMNTLLSVPKTIHDFDYNLLSDGLDQLARHAPQGIGGRDAAILATMRKAGIKTILTHDYAFRNLDEVTVIDPAEETDLDG